MNGCKIAYVVVELVLCRCRTLKCSALDAKDDSGIIWRDEDVPAEAVCFVFPTKREAL